MNTIFSTDRKLNKPLSTAEIMDQHPVDPSFSSLNFGKPLLTKSADIIHQSLTINQRYQPFDLTPQIQLLLQSLEKVPQYFSWHRRFFYQLPIIGFYFSPLRHIDQIRQEILQQITALNNLLKAQIAQVEKKVMIFTQLSSQNQILLLENKNYQEAGEKIMPMLALGSPELQRKIPSLKKQLSALELNQLSLNQYAAQLTQTLQALTHYLAKIKFITQSLFPLWRKQFQLIHDIVTNRERIKLIQSPSTHPITKTMNTAQKIENITQLNDQTIDNYEQDQFNLDNIQNIQRETISALKALL